MSDTAAATGPPEEASKVMLTRREKVFAVSLLVLVLVMGAGALLSGYMQNSAWQRQYGQGQQQAAAQARAAQQKQSALVQAQLCSIFVPIAQLKAPAGNAADPSRMWEQKVEAKLALVALVLKCKT